MTTQMQESVDTDILNMLDFSEAESCDYVEKKEPCPEAATWQITVSCCGTVYCFCDDHFDYILEVMEEYEAYVCGACKAVVSPPSAIIMAASRLDKR